MPLTRNNLWVKVLLETTMFHKSANNNNSNMEKEQMAMNSQPSRLFVQMMILIRLKRSKRCT